MKPSLTLVCIALYLCPSVVGAQPVCTSIPGASWNGTGNPGTTAKLKLDCTTTTTILIPNGVTLNGNGFTITALDPIGGHFLGAVVKNGGTTAHVTKLTVDAANLSNVCDAGDDRLRGILFDGASGKITNNKVVHINQGPSGCPEGNAIEVRNFTEPSTMTVTISGNHVYAWQKTGIVVNGDVDALVSTNVIGASTTQANLAANGIQIGFGANGEVSANLIEGNTWLGWSPASDFAATGILLYQAGTLTKVTSNTINLIAGNADAGIYVESDDVTVSSNRVYDFGPDVAGVNPEMDTGIYNLGNLNGGIDNVFNKNKVRCYQDAYNNVTGASNTILPCLDPTSTAIAAVARPASPFAR